MHETSLLWKGNHPPLPTNKAGSLRRLVNIRSRLQRMDMTKEYAQIIGKQKSEGKVEEVNDPPRGKEFYTPHKPVVRLGAESTKLRVIYEASASSNAQAPSLNDCPYPGPPLHNRLWSVLVRMRFHPVLVTGDLKQAFLQARIKRQERDALQFHRRANEHSEIHTSAVRFYAIAFPTGGSDRVSL